MMEMLRFNRFRYVAERFHCLNYVKENLFMDAKIARMSVQDSKQFMATIHYEPNPDASCEELQQEIKTLNIAEKPHTRNVA